MRLKNEAKAVFYPSALIPQFSSFSLSPFPKLHLIFSNSDIIVAEEIVP